jgi:hypothetical protein
MKVKDYMAMVLAAEGTRRTFAIIDVTTGIIRQRELYHHLEEANRIFVAQLGSGDPDPEIEFNDDSRQAATKVLNYIEMERLLTNDGISHYKNLLNLQL